MFKGRHPPWPIGNLSSVSPIPSLQNVVAFLWIYEPLCSPGIIKRFTTITDSDPLYQDSTSDFVQLDRYVNAFATFVSSAQLTNSFLSCYFPWQINNSKYDIKYGVYLVWIVLYQGMCVSYINDLIFPAKEGEAKGYLNQYNKGAIAVDIAVCERFLHRCYVKKKDYMTL